MKDIRIYNFESLSIAMKKLDTTGERCLVVINKNNKYLGTLTDGDIRRAILKGNRINAKINSFFSKNSTFVIENQYSENKIKKILNKKNNILIPVLNKNKNLINYITWKKVFGDLKNIRKIKNTSVVIMAGGKGTRLSPFTKILPKPLIPIKDKAVIEHIIDNFFISGIRKFFLTLNFKSKIIKSYFEEKEDKKTQIKFIEERKPLGTAGGLNLMKRQLSNNFFVVNCDIVVNYDYKKILDFHKNNFSDITIVASYKEFPIPYGVCQTNSKGNLDRILEKPSFNYLVNTGFYVVNKKVLSLIPKNKPFDMTDLITKLKVNGKKISIYPIQNEKWYDVGEWPQYNKVLNTL